jgi:hypothetical protein
MNLERVVERRYYKRYLVTGQAEFGGMPVEIANLGYRGIQIRCGAPLPVRTTGKVTFTVRGYETQFEVPGEVVGVGVGVAAIKFLRTPRHMDFLINWLVSENVPWVGLELVAPVVNE